VSEDIVGNSEKNWSSRRLPVNFAMGWDCAYIIKAQLIC